MRRIFFGKPERKGPLGTLGTYEEIILKCILQEQGAMT
jgi:hypothetical protein